MNNFLQKLSDWQKTTPGLITFILTGSFLAGWFVNQAIDTGSLLDYVLAFLLLVLIVQDVIRLVRNILIRLRRKGKRGE